MNPHADAEAWENRQDQMDQDWQDQAMQIMQECTEQDIDLALEDGFSTEQMQALASAVRQYKACDHEGKNDAAYMAAGRAFIEWMCEYADRKAKHG